MKKMKLVSNGMKIAKTFTSKELLKTQIANLNKKRMELFSIKESNIKEEIQ